MSKASRLQEFLSPSLLVRAGHMTEVGPIRLRGNFISKIREELMGLEHLEYGQYSKKLVCVCIFSINDLLLPLGNNNHSDFSCFVFDFNTYVFIPKQY